MGEKETGIRLRRYYDNENEDSDDSDEVNEGEFGYAGLILKFASSYAVATGGSPLNIILDTIKLLQFENALDEVKLFELYNFYIYIGHFLHSATISN